MERNYVGVVTVGGLEALLPENEEVVGVLDSRIYGQKPYLGFCFWAILGEEVADQILQHIQHQDR